MIDPQAAEFTRPFWEAVNLDRLVVPECQSCGRRFFTPEPLCVHCGSGDWKWTASPGDGEVYSVSVVHQPINNDHEIPFALSIIEMDDGWTMLAHVIGVNPEDVQIGMRVRFAPTRGLRGILPSFRPA